MDDIQKYHHKCFALGLRKFKANGPSEDIVRANASSQSILGRIISLPVADDQCAFSKRFIDNNIYALFSRATENLKTNLTQMQVIGQLWDSPEITNAFNTLSVNSTTANIGSFNGNRMFYANDYMVIRFIFALIYE